MLLFSLKLRSSKQMVLLRGNHESRNMTEAFTFRDEVVSKYDLELYDLFMDVFDSLPLAAVVANKYLAMHGGISPDLTHVDEINDINRFAEVPLSGAFCDLLWSDPMDDAQAAKGQFTKNEARDCSHYFGKKPVQKLLKHSKLLSVFRGH